MKKKLSNHFLPYSYTQQLYQSFHNLKKTGSVEEYGDQFYQLIARIDLTETEEQLEARFLSGLKLGIQDQLMFHTCWTLSQAYNRVFMVEKQLARKSMALSYGSRTNSQALATSTQTKPWFQG